MKTIYLFFALLFTAPANAETYLNLNTVAYHYDRSAVAQQHFNETTPGIGIEHERGDYRLMAGIYRNSIRRESVYALVGYMPVRHSALSIGVAGGMATGYLPTIVPAIGLVATLQFNRVGINLFAVPNMLSRGSYGFAGLQLRCKL